MSLQVYLQTPADRARAVDLVRRATKGLVIEIREPRRTSRQNRLLHALLEEVVEGGLATDDGRRLTFDEAKTALVTAWMIENGDNSDMVLFLNHPIQLRPPTDKLKKAPFSSLIDFIHAVCAMRGIQLREPT